MRVEEYLPIAGGFVLGCLTRYLYQRTGRWRIALVAVLLALAATVASGEFRESWGFLLVDIALVCASAFAGYLMVSILFQPGKQPKS